MSVVARLITWRNGRWLARPARICLVLLGVDLPKSVPVGRNLTLHHSGRGVVVSNFASIGNDVTIYPGVTIGRADAHISDDLTSCERIEIGDDVWLMAGCVVLGGPGVTRIGRGTIVGANSVVTSSTGDFEIWAGVPAHKLRDRDDVPIGEADR